MTRFEPVDLPPDRRLNGRVSQTFLKHYDRCPRSGYLYAKYKGEASTAAMQAGKALHAACERATRLMIDMGELTIPPDVVKVLIDEVFAEMPVPVSEHDRIREACFRWASEFAADPAAVVACETLFVLEVDEWLVRCRVDFAEMREGGAALYVADYKASRAAVGFEEISRRRNDGGLSTRAFQLILYALVLAFGVPVREEPCPECDGSGEIVHLAGPDSFGNYDDTGREDCPECLGRGVLETPEPFPVASRAQTFALEFVYPGIEDREGKMLRRPVTLTRRELEEYRASLAGLIARVKRSEQTGDWPAVVSDAACGECPAAVECPIPAQLRDHRGTINTPEQAAEALQKLDREKAEHRARQTELRNYVKANGGRLVAGRKVWELVYSESEEIRDREGMFEAMERSVDYGEPFERARFVKTKGRTDFKARDITDDEEGQDDGAGREGDRAEA